MRASEGINSKVWHLIISRCFSPNGDFQYMCDVFYTNLSTILLLFYIFSAFPLSVYLWAITVMLFHLHKILFRKYSKTPT